MTVYFALGLRSGQIKIGCVRSDLARRLKHLQSMRQEPIVVLATMLGGRRVESYWHRRHAASGERHYGRKGPGTGRLNEWFKPTPALVADIVELLDMGAPA